jgi:hypothetical protein
MVERGTHPPDPDEEKRLKKLDDIRGHELLPDDIKAQLPKLYSGETKGLEALALVKFFSPGSGWTWYASEFDGKDIFFGLVVGFEIELGYFSLSELRGAQDALQLPIERDLYFEPTSLKELREWHKKQRGE